MTIVLITVLILTAIDAIISNIKIISLKKKIWSILEKTGSGIEATNDDHTRLSVGVDYTVSKMTNSIRRANEIFAEIKKITTLSKKKK